MYALTLLVKFKANLNFKLKYLWTGRFKQNLNIYISYNQYSLDIDIYLDFI